MKPIALVALLVLLWSHSDHVAAGERVVYRTEPFELSGTLCMPEGSGPFAAVVYNHGGLGPIVAGAPEETCAALAGAGYVGFSPVRRLTRPLFGHIDDVLLALDYLAGLNNVDKSRLGMIGFSRGGLLSLMAATRRADLSAVVIMAPASGRGALDRATADFGSIQAPLLILVAENDTGSRRTQGQSVLAISIRLQTALDRADRQSQLTIYPPFSDDGHTLFFEVGSYWPDVQDFLSQHLAD
ncbi:MAG: dienelactone hydrolase family protein [Proteobacteria bacterium]|nr:dienelactone hydrolase family protein [Pseudomonadota bacterium]